MAAELRSQGACSTSLRLSSVPFRCAACPSQPSKYDSLQPQSRGGRSSHYRARLLQICKAAEESYPELEKLVQEKSTSGSETPMKVSFRDINTFNLWLWFEFHKVPSETERDLLETVLESWFVLGRMGGFNGMNMQVSTEAPGDASYFRYDEGHFDTALQAVFMEYSGVELQDKWCRFWVNMGTADEVALDILINALSVFSRENVGIKQLIVGGVNSDWEVPNKDEESLAGIMDRQAAADTVRAAERAAQKSC